jgi:hypothetical protein
MHEAAASAAPALFPSSRRGGAHCRARSTQDRVAHSSVESGLMRVMLAIWTTVILGGIVYFVVIGLSHH